MKKRRMLTKEELIYNAKKLNHMNKCRNSGASFFAACVTSNYVLWKQEGFYPKIIIDYNNRTRQYYDNYDESKIDEYNALIFDKCEFKVDIVKANTNNNKKRYIEIMNNKWNEIENDINEEFQRYMISTYLALIDMGYGSKRLNRINQEVIDLFNKCCEKENYIDEIENELKEYGVEIERPFVGTLTFMASASPVVKE